MNTSSPRPGDSWRPLTLLILGVAAVLVVAVRLIPYEYRLPNLTPAGALFLFAGARLKPGPACLVPFGLLAAIDLYFYAANGWAPPAATYVCYAIYLALGWSLLRKTESPLRIGPTILAGSVLFYLLTNFAVWLHHVIRPEHFVGAPFQYAPTFAGLMQCYEVALPFFRGTVIGDLAFAAGLFAAHTALARAYFPAERVEMVPAPNSEIIE
jgi:hypothetical protein